MPRLNAFFLLPLLLLGAACASGPDRSMSMQPGYQQGQYSIATLRIEAAEPDLYHDPEYIEIRDRLLPILRQRLPQHQYGEPVGLTIRIHDVSTEINAGRSWLVGDSYRIGSTIMLWEPESREPVNQPRALHVHYEPNHFGLIGAAVEDMTADTQGKVEAMVQLYATRLIHVLFPQTVQGGTTL